MKSLKNWTLRSKVTWSFMIVVCCVAILISLLYYKTQVDFFTENLGATDKIDIVYLMGNIDKQLRLCEKLSDWMYINRRIEPALIRDYTGNPDRFDRDIPTVQRYIDDQLNSSSVGKYVVFLYIKGNNEVILKSSNPDADWLGGFTETAWFAEGIRGGGKAVWPGIFENPAVYRTTDYIIPLTRPVIFADTRVPIGWHILAFSPALAGDVFEDFHQDYNRSIVLIDRHNRIVFHQNPNRIGTMPDYDFLDQLRDAEEGCFAVPLNGTPHLVTYRRSAYSGMTMLLIHSLKALDTQTNLIVVTLGVIFLLTLLMFFVLTYYLSNRLTKPLAAILDRLKAVSLGVFAPDASIAGNDEMGRIGRGINEMSQRIGTLMQELIRREHEKAQLEYRILLNQINPHFIYNVLNAIKVMADIQKIEGISKMAAALGTLLKELSKGSADQIPIRRELELLEQYLYIQKIRRQGLLTVQQTIADDSVLDCLIPRFTLQPLAENAVSHGIDRTNRMGKIDLTIRPEGEEVVIILRDNGAGIPPDTLKTLLTEEAPDADADSTHVGLMNVDKRIKLFFGTGGLTLESVLGEYTAVSIRFPRKKKE